MEYAQFLFSHLACISCNMQKNPTRTLLGESNITFSDVKPLKHDIAKKVFN